MVAKPLCPLYKNIIKPLDRARYPELRYIMEQKKYKQINTKTPEIQEMILSYQIGGVAYELSQRLEISPALALDLFYRSKTCAQLHDKRTGLYLMSNGYIADDFIYEKQRGY